MTRAAQPGASCFYWTVMGVCRGRTRSPTYGWRVWWRRTQGHFFLLDSCDVSVSTAYDQPPAHKTFQRNETALGVAATKKQQPKNGVTSVVLSY